MTSAHSLIVLYKWCVFEGELSKPPPAMATSAHTTIDSPLTLPSFVHALMTPSRLDSTSYSCAQARGSQTLPPRPHPQRHLQLQERKRRPRPLPQELLSVQEIQRLPGRRDALQTPMIPTRNTRSQKRHPSLSELITLSTYLERDVAVRETSPALLPWRTERSVHVPIPFIIIKPRLTLVLGSCCGV